jgi:hypothetical protein
MPLVTPPLITTSQNRPILDGSKSLATQDFGNDAPMTASLSEPYGHRSERPGIPVGQVGETPAFRPGAVIENP